MDETTIINLLTNSGLKVFGLDSDFIYFEDPSCVFPAFDTLLEYAWIAILVFTAIMLFGWGVLYIKNGVKIDTLFNNAKTLILVLCILGVVKSIVNLVYGDNLFAKQCEVKQVSRAAVNELLELRNKKLGKSDENILYENFSVIDSGVNYSDVTNEVLPKPTVETIKQESVYSGFKASDIKMVESGKGYVIYVKQDGTKIKRTGGTTAWRTNNPGNIIKSKFASENGAIGVAGRFAVFPNEETGLQATIKLLRSSGYINLQLRQVYHRWAPKGDGNNNPDAYANRVSKLSGVPLNKQIKELDDNEIMRVARAMQTVEGWTIGIEQKI
ncbi:MAG: hypothetical protein IKF41_02960 [Alphaproteobacteria bacterium]|nr:hypothetical protein [Alphaproteobacteria bacterium]